MSPQSVFMTPSWSASSSRGRTKAASSLDRGKICQHSSSPACFMHAGRRDTGASVPSDDAEEGLRSSIHPSGHRSSLALRLPLVVWAVNVDTNPLQAGLNSLGNHPLASHTALDFLDVQRALTSGLANLTKHTPNRGQRLLPCHMHHRMLIDCLAAQPRVYQCWLIVTVAQRWQGL